jgi:nicotinate-nucleotide adenylyltransferase
VLIVPAYRHPFDKLLAPYANRVEMCQLALGKLPQVEVSTLERELGGRSVTLRTLEALRKRLPNAKLRLVIGSDLLSETDSWHAFDRVRSLAQPLVVPRAGHDAPEDTELPEQPNFSSTEARERLRDGRSTHDLLDPVIAAYCRAHALYR